MANQNIIVSNDVFRQPERFQIRRINGTFVCEVLACLHQPCRAIKQHVSIFIGMCKGKFRLVAGYVLCDDLYVHEIMNCMQHRGENIINIIEEPIELTTVADLHHRGVCLKCMREVGAQVAEVLALQIPVDAVALRVAGFSLESLVNARTTAGLVIHPPITNRTLFDSQLKAAGFTASDFYRAGFLATKLSEKYFWQNSDNTTSAELEWFHTYAFFSASELRSAGYDAFALRQACFSVRDLKEAGFSFREVIEAGYSDRDLQSWDGDWSPAKRRKLMSCLQVPEASSSVEQPPSTEAELFKRIIRTRVSDVANFCITPLPLELASSNFDRKYKPKNVNHMQLSQVQGPVPLNFPTTFYPDAFLSQGHLKDMTQLDYCQNRLKEFRTALEGKSIYEFKASLV